MTTSASSPAPSATAPAPVDAARERAVVAAVPTGLLVGGSWRDADRGATLAVDDPSTGEVLTEVADASPADALDALDAVLAAQGAGPRPPPASAARSSAGPSRSPPSGPRTSPCS